MNTLAWPVVKSMARKVGRCTEESGRTKNKHWLKHDLSVKCSLISLVSIREKVGLIKKDRLLLMMKPDKFESIVIGKDIWTVWCYWQSSARSEAKDEEDKDEWQRLIVACTCGQRSEEDAQSNEERKRMYRPMTVYGLRSNLPSFNAITENESSISNWIEENLIER